MAKFLELNIVDEVTTDHIVDANEVVIDHIVDVVSLLNMLLSLCILYKMIQYPQLLRE